MKKILKFALISLTFIIVSCGKRAPNAGSSDVEDVVEIILKKQAYGSVERAPKELEIELIDVIKIDVDNEAERTKFSFRCKVKDSAQAEWEERQYRYKAIASYTEDGELYVEVYNSHSEPNW